MNPSEDTAGTANRRLTLVVTLLVSLAFSAFVLSLPVFPTNDGPMHVYYAAILRDLLFAKGVHYGAFYNIKHLLPPYSLYYYLLILLSEGMSFVAANKVVICLYIFSFAFGLRYLARSVGPSGDAMALAATPLLFCWALTMGFVNFCLSTTVLFWALGVWIRNVQQPSTRKRALFVLLAYTIMLTHPVPLLFLAGFCVVELAIRLLRLRAAQMSAPMDESTSNLRWSSLRSDAVAVVLALGSLGYVKLFATNQAIETQEKSMGFFYTLRGNFQTIRTLRSLTPFFTAHAPTPTYFVFRSLVQVLLLATLGLTCAQLYRSIKRDRGNVATRWTMAYTWACLALLMVVVIPLVPFELNGSAFFAARLHIYLWLTAAVAASGYCGLQRTLRPVAAVFSIVVTALTLALAQGLIRPVAYELSDQAPMPSLEKHHLGVVLNSGDGVQITDLYDPYLWGAASLYRRSGTALYNSPWLNLAIIPLGAQPTLGYCCFTAHEIAEVPVSLRERMTASPESARLVLRSVDFVVVIAGPKPAPSTVDALLAADTSDPQHPWGCRPYGWYAFCERRGDTAQRLEAEPSRSR
jgi:hypothetical protein